MRLTRAQKWAAGAAAMVALLAWERKRANAAGKPSLLEQAGLGGLGGVFGAMAGAPLAPEGSVTLEAYYRRSGQCRYARTYENGYVLSEPVADNLCE